MNFTDPRFLLDLAQTVIIVILWLRKPGTDAAAAVTAMRERLGLVEERIKHMPTSEELAELEGSVRTINERTAGMSESMNVMRNQLSRIDDFLRTNR